MVHFRSARRHWFLVLAMLSLMLFGSLPSTAAELQTGASAPMAITSVFLANNSGSVMLRGTGFSSGGDIYVAVYDQWGARLYETRWVTASESEWGLYPGDGFVAGGSFNATFEHLCGATVMARAYDKQTATWSNLLDIEYNVFQCDGPATDIPRGRPS
jgi:hypothetical protein